MALIRCREGEYAKDRVPVMTSVYGIPERMKELRGSLFVMFNKKIQRYEVHDSTQDDCTLACELPYEELDARALLYVREHMRERTEALIAEIERHNERVENEEYNREMDKAGYRMKNAIKWLSAHESAEELPEEMLNEE